MKFSVQKDGKDCPFVYNGQWENGKRTGCGTLYCLTTGDVYMGEFLDDAFNGQGIGVKKCGDFECGQWAKCKLA